MSFHEIRFPTAIALGASGGPERRTEIVVLGSGAEERNSRWADSRRRWNAGTGVKTLDQLHAVIAFFEERRGRLHGFRWKDAADWKSCPPQQAVAATDQAIGTGDGARVSFALIKTYGSVHAPWQRRIAKPVDGTVLVAVNGAARIAGTHFAVTTVTGEITFLAGHTPAAGAAITAGFQFDVPARFDTDRLEIDLAQFTAGSVPGIPIVEVRV